MEEPMPPLRTRTRFGDGVHSSNEAALNRMYQERTSYGSTDHDAAIAAAEQERIDSSLRKNRKRSSIDINIVQKSLTNFFSKKTIKHKNNQAVRVTEAPADPYDLPVCDADDSHPHECPFCECRFKSVQGLASHQNRMHQSSANIRALRFGHSSDVSSLSGSSSDSSSSISSAPAPASALVGADDMTAAEAMAIDSPYADDAADAVDADAGEATDDSPIARATKKRRVQYDIAFKVALVFEFLELQAEWKDAGVHLTQERYLQMVGVKVDQGLFSRWIKERENYSKIIKQKLSSQMKKTGATKLGSGRSAYFQDEERAVAKKIRDRRARNLAVSSRWILHQMRREMVANHYGELR